MKKWLICSWLHFRRRCYPRDRRYWHCAKCHPCNEDLKALFGEKP